VKRLLALSRAVLGLCFAQGSAARYVKVFQYGAWNGLAFFADDNGAFNLCAIDADHRRESQATLSFQGRMVKTKEAALTTFSKR
jgi:hypothetical protein